MGVTQGWLALALMATGATSSPEKPQPEIAYKFQMVEARGLAWRDPIDGLKPVVQHGAVSVWTAPADFLETLSERASGVVTAEAQIKGPANSPAHLTTKKNQAFVTKVSWRGEGKAPKRVVENVREGMVATVVGRKLDQGVLAQLAIEDIDIRSVHTIDAPAPKRVAKAPRTEVKACSTGAGRGTVSVTSSMESPAKADSDIRIVEQRESNEDRFGWLPSKAAAIVAHAEEKACCGVDKPKVDERAAQTAFSPSTNAQIQIPEIGLARAAGVWLIPEDGVLVVGFGPHTVADAEGRAVVRERLALITAEMVDDAEAMTGGVEVVDDSESPDDSPVNGPAPLAPIFKPILPVPPQTATSIPGLPSRTLPQGIHADGSPATLPPLPEDEEADLPAPADEASRPLPSPQSRRKPSPPPEPVAPAPASEAPRDEEAKEESNADEPAEIETPKGAPAVKRKKTDPDAGRASFVLPAALSAISSMSAMKPAETFRAPFQGAHFFVPLKPLSIKLPLNQKLEFELLGRIVADERDFDERMVAGN